MSISVCWMRKFICSASARMKRNSVLCRRQDITDDIYQSVIHHLHIGMSEYEISALLQYYAISAGAAQMSFETIVGTGERSALPHGRPTGRKIRAHEPILMDFGIQYKIISLI